MQLTGNLMTFTGSITSKTKSNGIGYNIYKNRQFVNQ